MARKFSRVLLSLATIGLGTSLFAQSADTQYDEKKTESDMDALKRWLLDKRMVTLKEIGGDLSLSGEVRTEFQDTNETRNRIKQRGDQGFVKKPAQAWDIEVNLMFDYRTDYTWASIKVEFDNDMGVRSGTTNRIRLEKAYLGGRFVSGDTLTFDGEIGRRNLGNVFDSKVEFSALFDGVLFRLNKAFQDIGDFYLNTGAFLVDDMTNHYGCVGELGMLRIANVGLGAKYSIIDWRKHFPNPLKNNRYDFLVQQFQLFYQMNPSWLNKKLIKFYAAGVNNLIADNLVLPNFYSQAYGELDEFPTADQIKALKNFPKASPEGISTTEFGKQNWGWYVGVSLGQVKKKGDWALDTNFQWMKAQVVPDYDASGIGRGNAAGVGLYTTDINGSGIYTTSQNATGPGNYYGFEIDALYAFTDNLTIEENFKWSNTLDTNLGPNLKYRQFEVEFIYAF
jgi:hypothetical protein